MLRFAATRCSVREGDAHHRLPDATSFKYIVPAAVTHTFPRQGDMPGNVKTTVPSKWGNRVGQTRDATADDGSSFQETLTDFTCLEMEKWWAV